MRIALIFLLLIGTAVAKPKPTPVPKPSPVMVCRTKQQDLELRDWIGGIMEEARKAKLEAAAANTSNEGTKTQLAQAKINAQQLADQCAADHACAQSPLSCWFHRFMKHLFWIIGAVLLLVVGLFIASFFFPALGPILGFLTSIWKRVIGLFKPKAP